MTTEFLRLRPSGALAVTLAFTCGMASAQQLYRLTDLGTLGGSFSTGDAINSAGQICGPSSLPNNPIGLHAFFWDGSAMEDNGTLDRSMDGCADLNLAGQVTGTGFFVDGSNHAYVWDGATPGHMMPSSRIHIRFFARPSRRGLMTIATSGRLSAVIACLVRRQKEVLFSGTAIRRGAANVIRIS